ncbi:MAG: NAD-dependent epimerase/dehydratase family protein [Methanomassiliicoccales archaeon]|nr:NAD-dependent epimerase/dehydratase family protein [Methanomassiliicoccales archaeon]
MLELRRKYGGENVIAAIHKRRPSAEVEESGPVVTVDLGSESAIYAAVEDNGISEIWHLAAVLSVVGENDPQQAWNVNMGSLYNVLEVARKAKLEKVFWPSSIAVFGPGSPRIETPQETVMLPTSMYGVTKVAGELLCNYYWNKYGLDVRSVRYPGIISSATPPGGGTTDYSVEMFYEAIQRGKYTCFVREDTILPLMYMPDCIDSAVELMEAALSKLKRHDSYNVAGASFSAGELAEEIKKHIPDFEIDYKPDHRQKIADSWPMSVDDRQARKDWGWSPKYDLRSMTDDMIKRLGKRMKRK